MSEPLSGVLYLVATPIGNLADLSPRAQHILRNVDFIAAEDTRVSLKLLSRFDIRKELVSYHEHNSRFRGEQILSRLQAGQCAALVTDAGTPAISDPGEDVVRLCAENAVPVVSVPGACAAVTALSVSALATSRFCFEGFLGAEKKERLSRLEALRYEERTMIFYEAPHRLLRALEDLCAVFGAHRRLSLCRELTKLNEEVLRCTLGEALARFSAQEPRGEFVLVVEGGRKKEEAPFWDSLSLREHHGHYLAQGMKPMDACKAVAKDRGLSKSQVYDQLMK